MERQFVKRDTRNQKLIAGGARSPVVLDYIMDSEVPRPCRHFVGREEELGELHTMLEKEALAQIKEITESNAHLVSNLHANLGGLYRMNGQTELAKEHMEKGILLLEQYQLLYTNDSIPQINNYAALLTEMQEPERAMSALQKLAQIIKDYNSDHCLDI